MLLKVRYFLIFFIFTVNGKILDFNGVIKGLNLFVYLVFIYDILIKGWFFIVYVCCFEGIFKAPLPNSNTKPIVIIVINPNVIIKP